MKLTGGGLNVSCDKCVVTESSCHLIMKCEIIGGDGKLDCDLELIKNCSD